MYCQNRMVHTVQEGDSLYRLARQYHTTVTELILGNPGVNPYNLQVGMKLYVCPGESYVPPQGGSANTGNTGNSEAPGTPVMLEMVEIPVMPAWAETSVSEW